MAIELVTGHAGEGHVSSADAGRLNAGVCGTGKYVLNTGLKFAYSIESANLIRIASGDAVNQGRHIIIPQNTYEDAALINGTQGKTRVDVIALRYSKVTRQVNSETVTVETASVEVIKGTEAAAGSTPEVPAVVSGDIFNGAMSDDMPLYHVLITNTSVTSVTPVFTVMPSITELNGTMGSQQNTMGSLSRAITNITDKIGDVTMGTVATTITGAIKEIIDKIGSVAMGTTATTLTGAIKEINEKMPVHIDDTWQYTAIGIGANLAYSATKNIAKAGYTPTGIKGYRILNNDTNGKNAGWVVMPKLWIDGDSMEFTLWNQHLSQQAIVKVQIKVEYVSVNAT